MDQETKDSFLNLKNTNAEGLSPLRTYKADVNDAIKNRELSATKVLMAEQRRRTSEERNLEETSFSSKKNTLAIALSVLLLLGGVGFAVYSTLQPKDASEKIKINLPSDIGAEKIVQIKTDNKQFFETVGEMQTNLNLAKQEISQKKVYEIYLTKDEEVLNGEEIEIKTKKLSLEEFFANTESGLSSDLIRSLGQKYYWGVVYINKPSEYFIFSVSNYELAFASILSNEISFGEFFSKFFDKGQNIQENISVSTTTATTSTTTPTTTDIVTETTERNFRETIVFKDEILKNQDTRILYNKDGSIRFFYSFVNNKKNLIIISDPEGMEELLRRINTSSYIR